MAWNSTELTQVTSSLTASALLAELTAEFATAISHALRFSISVDAIARACEKEIDEEAKLTQAVAIIVENKGWTLTPYHRFGEVEFRA